MKEIIDHYGGVVIALFSIVAALAIAAAVVMVVSRKSNESVEGLKYNNEAQTAVQQGWEAATTS